MATLPLSPKSMYPPSFSTGAGAPPPARTDADASPRPFADASPRIHSPRLGMAAGAPVSALTAPRHDAIQRFSRRIVERSAGRPDAGVRDRAAASQHFLADRHPDPFLELEAHQRHALIEDVSGLVHGPRAEEGHDLHEDGGKREAGHRAGAAGHQLFEQEHAAQPAEDGDVVYSGGPYPPVWLRGDPFAPLR